MKLKIILCTLPLIFCGCASTLHGENSGATNLNGQQLSALLAKYQKQNETSKRDSVKVGYSDNYQD